MNWDGEERRQPSGERLGMEKLERYIDEVHALTLRHDKALFGPDGRGGMSVDVVLMKQAGKVAAWIMGTTCAATIVLTINQFGKLLFR